MILAAGEYQTMAEIQLRNLSKRWGTFVGVDNFDLTISDKEFLVLLGPSGCGKTTTMRMIAGLEDATEGDILIDGKVVNDLQPKDRDVAMVFQSYALYPNMNVYENIRFPLKVRGVDPKTHDAKVRRASAMVELDPFLHRKPAELSGGQRQRVALARAIVREPNVFLMDEPLSNLDAKLRRSVRDEIRELQTRLSLTVVYVTHDQEEALAVSDEIIVMETGTIAQTGDPRSLYDQPESLFVANFVGDTNILPFIVEQKDPSPKSIKISDFITQYENTDLKDGTGSALIRPEHVNLNHNVSKTDLQGTVTKATYVGSKMEYTVATNVGNVFVIKNSNENEFSEGQLVSIELPTDKLRIFNK